MNFSIIIPVFNRPDEVKELLESLSKTTYTKNFEIVIVEDGSSIDCKSIVSQYQSKLNISYFYKENSGPGDSRNYGMRVAKGDYFLIFDSDCIIPEQYLNEVEKELNSNYVDCFGGPDSALKSFSSIQKAINFTMTSFITTGGIRGGSERVMKFQPRSFNMGISKKAFIDSKGFGNIHPGEDPDLSIRLWKLGYQTRLFEKAFVFHKRRIDWEKFTVQVNKFGKARPILNSWYPEYNKLTFWFPSFFIIGLFISLFLLIFLIDLPLKMYFIYFILVFIISSIQNKSLKIGWFSIIAVWKQFYGYGIGFLISFFKINILKKKPKDAFPELFFKINSNNIKIDKSIINTFPIVETNTNVSNNSKSPKIIGITGGIGSGKTTVAKYFESLGIPIYIADLEARKVMDMPNVSSIIINKFGKDICINNQLDRQKLSAIVFKNPEKLKLLNSIVHPNVKIHFENWVAQNRDHEFLIKESAILFESGSFIDCEYIITVTAPLETRIQRVMQRDKVNREQVEARINNQMSDEERIKKSDFVINNINFEEVKTKIIEIIKKMKEK